MRCEQKYAVFLALALLLLSCDLFTPRDAEQPGTQNESLPIAFTKEILFDNFQKSFQQKNKEEYLKLFSDAPTDAQQFIFVPNPAAGARYSFSWNKNLEKEYFDNVVASVGLSSSIQIGVSSVQIIPFQSDSVKYSFGYTLFVPHTRNDVTTQFTGNCDIFMSPDRNKTVWKIYRWVDFDTKKDSSWSDLKGQFAK